MIKIKAEIPKKNVNIVIAGLSVAGLILFLMASNIEHRMTSCIITFGAGACAGGVSAILAFINSMKK